MKGHGNKRQFTLLATTSAAGDTLPQQVVVKGKTKAALPNGAGIHYTSSYSATNSKGTVSTCFILAAITAIFSNIASFCVTDNHWSDNVRHLPQLHHRRRRALPYFRKKITELRAVDASLCKEFGTQICVVIVDCWWGWIDAGFKSWLATTYPWIRLLFVPASCTPVAQPMDAGIIAKMKGLLRRYYGAWVVELTQAQIKAGTEPKDISVPADVPTCKRSTCSSGSPRWSQRSTMTRKA